MYNLVQPALTRPMATRDYTSILDEFGTDISFFNKLPHLRSKVISFAYFTMKLRHLFCLYSNHLRKFELHLCIRQKLSQIGPN